MELILNKENNGLESKMTKKGLLERLDEGPVICAEGFMFELERRGYISCDVFVPEIIIENPHILEQLHRDFQHAGSTVVEAFTYSADEKRLIEKGLADQYETMNRDALKIAKKVADTNPTGIPDLMAGNISNSNVWEPDNPEAKAKVRESFEQMVKWAVEEGADMIIGETFYYLGEALLALEIIKSYNMPAVITISVLPSNKTKDGFSITESLTTLDEAGADVVGMNCFRGPKTMLPHLLEARKHVKGHMGALPVPYRTTEEHPTYLNLPDDDATCECPHETTFPTALDPMFLNRYEMGAFAKEAYENGIKYLGVCCGNNPMLTRTVAEAAGLTPPASKYTETIKRKVLIRED